MKKRRNQQVIILETCPEDQYHLHEGNPLLSGRCIYHGKIYPIFSEDKTSYAIVFQKYTQVVSGTPKTEEILLSSEKTTSKDSKTLSNLVHSLAKAQARKIAKLRHLKVRTHNPYE
jgi:hypothetical protein